MIVDKIIITEWEDREGYPKKGFKYKVEMPFYRTGYGLDMYYFKNNDTDNPYIHRYYNTKEEVIEYIKEMTEDDTDGDIEYYCISSECDWGYDQVQCLEVKSIPIKDLEKSL